MNIRFLLAGSLLLATPVMILLPGCGGGGSSLFAQNFSSTVGLGAGQSGALTVSVSGGTATGRLVVSNSANSLRQTDTTLPTGTYSLSGTYSSSEFTLNGNIPSVGSVSIAGQVPSNGGDGQYRLTVNDENFDGSFTQTGATATPIITNTPKPGVTATATPKVTATPIATKTAASTGNSQANLTIVSQGDANFGNASFIVKNGTTPLTRQFFLVDFVDGAGRAVKLSCQGEAFGAFTVGDTYDASGLFSSVFVRADANRSWGSFDGGSGTLVVTSVQGNVVTFKCQDVVLKPSTSTQSSATGTLAVAGTFTLTFPAK